MKGKKAIQSKARIKKIMQEDEEVGKVAQGTPLVISKALELFLRDIVTESCEIARVGGSKKLMPYHVKRLGQQNRQYDFLDELLAPISDPLGANAPTTSSLTSKGDKKSLGKQVVAGPSASSSSRPGGVGGNPSTEVKEEYKPVVGVTYGMGGGGQTRAPSGAQAHVPVAEDDYDEEEDSDESE